jgi:hypothetical protein
MDVEITSAKNICSALLKYFGALLPSDLRKIALINTVGSKARKIIGIISMTNCLNISRNSISSLCQLGVCTEFSLPILPGADTGRGAEPQWQR